MRSSSPLILFCLPTCLHSQTSSPTFPLHCPIKDSRLYWPVKMGRSLTWDRLSTGWTALWLQTLLRKQNYHQDTNSIRTTHSRTLTLFSAVPAADTQKRWPPLCPLQRKLENGSGFVRGVLTPAVITAFPGWSKVTEHEEHFLLWTTRWGVPKDRDMGSPTHSDYHSGTLSGCLGNG